MDGRGDRIENRDLGVSLRSARTPTDERGNQHDQQESRTDSKGGKETIGDSDGDSTGFGRHSRAPILDRVLTDAEQLELTKVRMIFLMWKAMYVL